MDKGNCVVKFEFHYQMCEFLAHSKELIKSFVKYQISVFKFSLFICITGKVLLQRPLIAS